MVAKQSQVEAIAKNVGRLKPVQSLGVLTSTTTNGISRVVNPNYRRPGSGRRGNVARWA